ncbi:E4 orf6 [Simian adenovirus 48]|uniref:E4 orf6 n=1 Tax=Simian adenovirus 48 TaxID=995021 RepID=A0A9W3I4R7_9ADEN|nr:E4 orf6 [Simian adenovirus 48]
MAQRVRRYRCRLNPYQEYPLPPSENAPETFPCPQLPDCDMNTMHDVSAVRGMVGCVGFAVFMEWPVPWDMILTSYEWHLLKHYLNVCISCATIDLRRSSVIHGNEVWTLHCHCNRPGSLQCMAGGIMLATWFNRVVYGAAINQRCIWYREVVNYQMPKEVLYVGSVYMRGRHLIYLNIRYDVHAQIVKQFVSMGWCQHAYGIMNNLVVLCCISCASLSEMRMRCCAKRTRRLMRRAVLAIVRHGRFRLQPSAAERRRQDILRDLYVRQRPVTYEVYDNCRSRPR